MPPVPTPRATRRLQLSVLAACLAVAIAGCGQSTPSGATLRGLVILSGDVGQTRLTVHAVADGTPAEIGTPDAAAAWISGGAKATILATLADGGLATRNLDGTPDAKWHVVKASGTAPETSLFFGAMSPDGKQIAALTAGAAGSFGVAVVDVSSGRSITFPVGSDPKLTSPAWIDGARVGIVATDSEGGGAVTIANVPAGSITGGPGDVRAVSISADGSSVAWVADSDGTLQASNTKAWLAGEPSESLTIGGPSGTTPGSFAMDGTGARLAVVWERADGTAERIGVYARGTGGWSNSDSLDPPGGDPRAVVTWVH
jgi:hypothetical protein